MIQGFGGVLVAVSSSNRVMILTGSSEPASAAVASAPCFVTCPVEVNLVFGHRVSCYLVCGQCTFAINGSLIIQCSVYGERAACRDEKRLSVLDGAVS